MALFPDSAAAFLSEAASFELSLQKLKAQQAPADYGWYPYNSLTVLTLLVRLIEPVYAEIANAVQSAPAADIGCGDGDLAALLVSFGAEVDAIDHRESNFNQMRGVELLREEFGGKLSVFDRDLDNRFELPRGRYGFAFFLGTLYHLKNPFYVLEKLAMQVDWCVVSTRIAQCTPNHTAIEKEPLAYLLGSREANNDPTNFWIFSPAGLSRLLDRTGWIVVNEIRTGCLQDSNPVHPQADERMFVLIKSKRLQPGFHVRAVSGLYPPEPGGWCWTAKQFQLEVVFADGQQPSEFALRLVIPEAVSPVVVNCQINSIPTGSLRSEHPETIEFRGQFPNKVDSPLRLEFKVESAYQASGSDQRELGVILPLDGNTNQIPFRIS